jgi:23S rRNA (cytidine1920-2'-O)/16S rRNA (cytidine1409-2'-O)-methyltransferase
VDPATPLELVGAATYVSRGGEKLAAALDAFAVDPAGRICLDVGASTGGFTDCLLRRGASRVYALDVGRGQLAESLRADPRVVVLERTHAARLEPDHPQHLRLPEAPSLATMDVSFISATRLLAGVVAQLAPASGGTGASERDVIVLVKPQFEAGRADVERGVVRDPAVRRAAVERVARHAVGLGLTVAGEVESPLVGPAGNHETFLHLALGGGAPPAVGSGAATL